MLASQRRRLARWYRARVLRCWPSELAHCAEDLDALFGGRVRREEVVHEAGVFLERVRDVHVSRCFVRRFEWLRVFRYLLQGIGERAGVSAEEGAGRVREVLALA